MGARQPRVDRSSAEIETLARTVPDNGGVYFVPAFSGLYAPHWNDGARGSIAGLTRFANRGHLARAVLEATAFQTWEVLQAMEKDSGVSLEALRVDGGMTDNELLMQFQADIVDRAVVRPAIKETTALGAAFAAGLAAGVFRDAGRPACAMGGEPSLAAAQWPSPIASECCSDGRGGQPVARLARDEARVGDGSQDRRWSDGISDFR